LYGSFHATFVFLRLTQFMARALSRLPDSPLRTEVGIRFQRHFLGLLRGLDVVSSLGVFSAKGREELAEWKDIAADLRLQHGDPDPAVASKLNWDYEPPPSSP
jgi:hypothetical protein